MAGNRKIRAQVGKAVLHDSTWADVLGRKDISIPRSIGRTINRGSLAPVIIHWPATELEGPWLLRNLNDVGPVGRARLLEERVVPIKGGCHVSRRSDDPKPRSSKVKTHPWPDATISHLRQKA